MASDLLGWATTAGLMLDAQVSGERGTDCLRLPWGPLKLSSREKPVSFDSKKRALMGGLRWGAGGHGHLCRPNARKSSPRHACHTAGCSSAPAAAWEGCSRHAPRRERERGQQTVTPGTAPRSELTRKEGQGHLANAGCLGCAVLEKRRTGFACWNLLSGSCLNAQGIPE